MHEHELLIEVNRVKENSIISMQSFHLLFYPVDGGFGEWGDWSECSLTCGIGMQSRERKCDSPKPQNGGKPCDGTKDMYVNRKYCRKRKCSGTDHFNFLLNEFIQGINRFSARRK